LFNVAAIESEYVTTSLLVVPMVYIPFDVWPWASQGCRP